MILQHFSQRVFTIPGPEFGVEFLAPSISAAASWWLASGVTPLAAYQAKGAASYAASLVNLITPGTYNLTESNGSITWDASYGWQFTAAENKALKTGITPGAAYTVLCQFSDYTTSGDTVLFGTIAVNAYFYISPNRNSKVRYVYGDGTADVAPAFTAGNIGIAGGIGYRNGVANTGAIGAFPGTSKPLPIGAWTTNGTTFAQFCTAKMSSFIIFSSTLTGPQVALQVAAMAAL